MVDLDDNGKPGCSCHDFMCREKECKHIRAVKEKCNNDEKVVDETKPKC
tara:strand:+ start:750 stop:896 length:147 start_codon:yes stop_codon:yes gene_type:complete